MKMRLLKKKIDRKPRAVLLVWVRRPGQPWRIERYSGRPWPTMSLIWSGATS